MTPGAILGLSIFFGMVGMIGLALIIWAKLLDPEQIRIEWDDEDPDRMP